RRQRRARVGGLLVGHRLGAGHARADVGGVVRGVLRLGGLRLVLRGDLLRAFRALALGAGLGPGLLGAGLHLGFDAVALRCIGLGVALAGGLGPGLGLALGLLLVAACGHVDHRRFRYRGWLSGRPADHG